MIKLFSLKQEKKDGEQTSRGTQKKASAAQLRIQKGNHCKPHHPSPTKKQSSLPLYICIYSWSFQFATDINDLNLPKTCTTEFPDPDDLLNFKLNICPDEGFYKGGRFIFNFKVFPNWIILTKQQRGSHTIVACICYRLGRTILTNRQRLNAKQKCTIRTLILMATSA